MGHVPTRSHLRSQYPSEQTIEDLSIARLHCARAQKLTSSFGSSNERRMTTPGVAHQGQQARGDRCGRCHIHFLNRWIVIKKVLIKYVVIFLVDNAFHVVTNYVINIHQWEVARRETDLVV